MEYDPTKTPSQLADEARQTGQEAANTAQGYARAASQIGQDGLSSIRSSADDAMQLGRDALDAAQAYAGDAKDLAGDAADTGRAYAKSAVDAAGKKIGQLKDRMDDARQTSAKYVADEPVRSVLIAAAGGALLTALFLAVMRGSRRYD